METKIINSGKSNASKALILLHGRGSNASDILSLAHHLNVKDFALYAPEALNGSWYPQSFLAKPEENEPWLSASLKLVSKTVAQIVKDGISKENIYFAGFSQGACLVAEYTSRHATKYGGIAIFTGGLIGNRIYEENYSGNFEGTPIFIGSSNPDFHVPVERVYATTNILKNLGATVTEKIYDNVGHTIIADEIERANDLIFN
ncbi:phospholipase/carboxylesterase [Flavobacterium noncentrifugens]|uniref:Phospholipase/carboxylesterase n=1 Tax=Flavobacterium noncentrifugens TaxID=1128970 RepID=A0A1G8XX53_9FLAO|nr:dienelactone hydrolase family protein [Flavobacterium noncentrifugens]GEP52197.1 phospholipase/carboxylesterase [Flavobacterium noncentrifugens]SDJ94350.1 phospholipase/carboxylesterase [Flavobacterium noncentrifugens]